VTIGTSCHSPVVGRGLGYTFVVFKSTSISGSGVLLTGRVTAAANCKHPSNGDFQHSQFRIR
jgi:hypothetical protein